MTMEEYKIESKRMAYITTNNGKLFFIKGEFKDQKGHSCSLEFYRWQIEHYLNNYSDFTVQVKEVFKDFVKMAEVFNPEILQSVYNTLKVNDHEMFKVLNESIIEVKKEIFNRY